MTSMKKIQKSIVCRKALEGSAHLDFELVLLLKVNT